MQKGFSEVITSPAASNIECKSEVDEEEEVDEGEKVEEELVFMSFFLFRESHFY